MTNRNKKNPGFTLIELLVSLVIFSTLMSITFMTFSTISNTVSKISDATALNDKANRLLTFMEDDLRTIGHLVSPDTYILFCLNPAGNSPDEFSRAINITKGNPYDTLSFVSAIPITLDNTSSSCINNQSDCPTSGNPGTDQGTARKDYYLTSRCDSGPGTDRTTTVVVDAVHRCYTSQLHKGTTYLNSKSLITFQAAVTDNSESLTYYWVTDISNNTLTLDPPLKQKIPDNSTLFTLRQYRYEVLTTPTSAARTLRRVTWKSDCGTDPISISDPVDTGGGVDGLKYDFSSYNPITDSIEVTSSPPTSLRYLKYITVWMLLRSDRKTAGYTNRESYELGNAPDKLTLGPYNDSYTRKLVFRTVEVTNFVSKG